MGQTFIGALVYVDYFCITDICCQRSEQFAIEYGAL